MGIEETDDVRGGEGKEGGKGGDKRIDTGLKRACCYIPLYLLSYGIKYALVPIRYDANLPDTVWDVVQMNH